MSVRFTIEFPLRVVVYPAPDLAGQWVAHGLETDLITQGDSVEHAVAMMADAVETLAAYHVEHGLFPVRLRPAPEEVWALAGQRQPSHVVARATLTVDKPHAGGTSRASETPSSYPLYTWVSARPPARRHAG